MDGNNKVNVDTDDNVDRDNNNVDDDNVDVDKDDMTCVK